MSSGHAFDLGDAEIVEAVHESDTDVDFGGLAVGVSSGDAFAEGFQASHRCLDPTSGMIAGPSLADGPPEVPGGAQDLVASRCGWTVFFPKAPVLTDGDDGGCACDGFHACGPATRQRRGT